MLNILLPFLQPIIDKVLGFIPDPAEKAKAQAEMIQQIMSAASAADAAQNEVNKTEAASNSIFVAGWRPFIGWVCGSALGFHYIVRPLTIAVAIAAGYPQLNLPGLDDDLWQLMLGMLGLGGLRTYEKVRSLTK